MINNVITSLVNFMHKKVDGIENDWTRRSVGFIVFLLMLFVAAVGCLIELLALCVFAVFKTTVEYIVGTKDDAIAFLERYIDLW